MTKKKFVSLSPIHTHVVVEDMASLSRPERIRWAQQALSQIGRVRLEAVNVGAVTKQLEGYSDGQLLEGTVKILTRQIKEKVLIPTDLPVSTSYKSRKPGLLRAVYSGGSKANGGVPFGPETRCAGCGLKADDLFIQLCEHSRAYILKRHGPLQCAHVGKGPDEMRPRCRFASFAILR